MKTYGDTSYTISVDGITNPFSGTGEYNSYFDYNYEGMNPFSSIDITSELSITLFSMNVYFVNIYNTHEGQEFDQRFSFDFTDQNTIDNEYNLNINYNTSNAEVFELYYGNPSEGQEWVLLNGLDSVSQTSESFEFTSVKDPIIRIYASETCYDYESIGITIDEINITALYYPFEVIMVYNFTYKINPSPTIYTEDFTTSFDGIYNCTYYIYNIIIRCAR